MRVRSPFPPPRPPSPTCSLTPKRESNTQTLDSGAEAWQGGDSLRARSTGQPNSVRSPRQKLPRAQSVGSSPRGSCLEEQDATQQGVHLDELSSSSSGSSGSGHQDQGPNPNADAELDRSQGLAQRVGQD